MNLFGSKHIKNWSDTLKHVSLYLAVFWKIPILNDTIENGYNTLIDIKVDFLRERGELIDRE